MLKDKMLTLNMDNIGDREELCALGRALSVPDRIRIVNNLYRHSMNLNEIAKELGLPISSVSNHIDALVKANLVIVTYQPGLKGHVKLCSPMITNINIYSSANANVDTTDVSSYEMPVGMFSECRVYGGCGMCDTEKQLFPPDNPNSFYRAERRKAELIWFSYGYVSYDFPYVLDDGCSVKEITFSLEICSEAMYYRNVWPSEITFYINGVEIFTYTSPGDFGGRRGVYTPKFWATNSTQFGLLKKISVNESGAFLDDVLTNPGVTLKDLNIQPDMPVRFKIAIKEDAKYRGGINIFGKQFGDFPQAIVMIMKSH